MSISERARVLLDSESAASDQEIAERIVQEADESELVAVVAEVVAHQRRHQVRREERSVTAAFIKRHRPVSQSLTEWVRPADGSGARAAKLLAASWRLGDGSAVEIGKATLDEVRQRIALLRKQRAGLDESIAFLEEVEATLVETGARCLYDLAPPDVDEAAS